MGREKVTLLFLLVLWAINRSVWSENSLILVLAFIGFYVYRMSRNRGLKILGLVTLFGVGLKIHSLLAVSSSGIWLDWERMNLFNYQYDQHLSRYLIEAGWQPYPLRELVYGGWLKIYLVLESFLRLISPVSVWRVVGFSGLYLTAFNLKKIRGWEWGWIAMVILAGAMAVATDTRKAWLMAVPVLGFLAIEGRRLKGKAGVMFCLLVLIDLWMA